MTKKIERLDIYLYTYCEINKDSLIGASMSIFEPETTNPKSPYEDASKDIACANPIQADCRGRFPKVFIEKPYRVAINNRYGEMVFEDAYDQG